jgi:hypothetical protein
MLDLSPVRIQRYNEQRGRCLYCCNPMWEEAIEPQGIALTRIRHTRVEKLYGRIDNLSSFACTAEHLLPQSQGGTDVPHGRPSWGRGSESSRKARMKFLN